MAIYLVVSHIVGWECEHNGHMLMAFNHKFLFGECQLWAETNYFQFDVAAVEIVKPERLLRCGKQIYRDGIELLCN